MATLRDIIKSNSIRLTHKKGGFAAEYDWQRGIIRFVDRSGTIDYDLVKIAEEMQQAQEPQPHV